MTFAFAAGASTGAFSEAIDRASVCPTTWEPALFEKDLFLSDFVARAFAIVVDGRRYDPDEGYITRVLAAAPSDHATVLHRQGILRELLGEPAYRAELEGLYATMRDLRSALEETVIGKIWDANRRQLDILALAKQVFDKMAGSFESATSGLTRVRDLGLRVVKSEGYRSLRDLLDYDENLATLTVKLRVGSDGRIRGFELLEVEENESNPFVVSPVRRALSKLELLARGYRFGEAEIMGRLLDAVFEGVEEELSKLPQLMADIEVYLGALGFRDLAAEAGLEVCLADLRDERDEGGPHLRGLFNPLLLAHGVRPVPCDIELDRHATTLIITGPNSGGKTRLLQSLGLSQLLAQGGMLVPAREARLRAVPSLVMSLSEEPRADQSEGRLGSELLRIRALFERLPRASMVVLDELCSGTNPSEGEELFELVVTLLAELRPQAFITTHFLAFAARLERERHVRSLRFVQVQLDDEQRATYQFVPGVATTSLAGQAASRLGVTREKLFALIEAHDKATPAAGATVEES